MFVHDDVKFFGDLKKNKKLGRHVDVTWLKWFCTLPPAQGTWLRGKDEVCLRRRQPIYVVTLAVSILTAENATSVMHPQTTADLGEAGQAVIGKTPPPRHR